MQENVIADLDHFERVIGRFGCTLERYRHKEPAPLHGIHQGDRYTGCVAPSTFMGKTEVEVAVWLAKWLREAYE